MITKLKRFSLIICVFLVTGCTGVDKQQVMEMNATPNVAPTPIITPTPTPTPKPMYDTKTGIPLTAGNVQWGTVTVNQSEIIVLCTEPENISYILWVLVQFNFLLTLSYLAR